MDEQTNLPTNGEELSLLRELALALILPRQMMTQTAVAGEEPNLLPGQLAPGFSDGFPLPPDARVVGSLMGSQPILVLDTEHPGEDVADFYERRLTELGWKIEEFPGPRQGGFLASGGVDRHFANFYRDEGAALQLMTYETPQNRTGVQLTLFPDDPDGTRAEHRAMRMLHDPWRILPPIAPPLHAIQQSEGGNSGNDHVSTSASIQSDADLATLAAHYNGQLERGGWQRQDGGESNPVAWSTWTFEDDYEGVKEPWRALFVLLKWPGEPRRSQAQLFAERMDKRTGGIRHPHGRLLGWQSHTTRSGS